MLTRAPTGCSASGFVRHEHLKRLLDDGAIAARPSAWVRWAATDAGHDVDREVNQMREVGIKLDKLSSSKLVRREDRSSLTF